MRNNRPVGFLKLLTGILSAFIECFAVSKRRTAKPPKGSFRHFSLYFPKFQCADRNLGSPVFHDNRVYFRPSCFERATHDVALSQQIRHKAQNYQSPAQADARFCDGFIRDSLWLRRSIGLFVFGCCVFFCRIAGLRCRWRCIVFGLRRFRC